MANVNYERTHPLYDLMLPDYKRAADLYDGGRFVERGGVEYLTPHPFEKDNQFAIRGRRAAYRNYAAPTVDLFASSVTDGVDRRAVASIPEFQAMTENSDRRKNTPDSFFKNVVTRSAAVGASFVLVDMPRFEVPVIRMDAARAYGLSPFFVHVPATNIIAWDYAEDGTLDWAVQRDIRQESGGPFTEYVTVKTITLWRKTGWSRFVSRDGGEFVSDGEGFFSLGVVPLVPFLYEEDSPMTGRSAIDDVASLLVRVYNQDSELDKMLFDAALPILAVFGLREEEEDAIVKASNFLWRFANSDVRLEYVEPAGAAFSAKRQQIQDDVDGIREISLRQTRAKSAQVESAESKRLDTVQISSQLAGFARTSADAEKRCWEIAGKYIGVSDSVLRNVEIKYNETFDPESIRGALTQRYIELRRNGDISRETVWRQLGWTDEEIVKEAARLAKEQNETIAPFPSFGGYAPESVGE